MDDSYAMDFVSLEKDSLWLKTNRIQTNRSHGTGDTFSSCILAELAKGNSLKDAIITSKDFIYCAIKNGIHVGHGHGPVNHWTKLEGNLEIVVKD